MRHDVSVTELRSRFASLLRLAESGDEIVVRRRGERIAVIVGARQMEGLSGLSNPDWRESLRAWRERPDRPRFTRVELDEMHRESRAGLR